MTSRASMAAYMRNVIRALQTSGLRLLPLQGELLAPSRAQAAPCRLARTSAAAITQDQTQRDARLKKRQAEEEEKRARRRNKRELWGAGRSSLPVDDVFLLRMYARPRQDARAALAALRRYALLDYADPAQGVHVRLGLNLSLDKNKKVEAFRSYFQYPNPLVAPPNGVLVFTSTPEETQTALQHGARLAGGDELVQQVLQDQVDQVSFYVSVPGALPKLVPLRNVLRNNFPRARNGSVAADIPKMLEYFTTCHEYSVLPNGSCVTRIGTMDMTDEQLLVNLQTLLADVCSRRTASSGGFVTDAHINTATSEELPFHFEPFLPPPPKSKREAKERAPAAPVAPAAPAAPVEEAAANATANAKE
ncbi:large ribosomal subunit protein uL1m [Lethenteron reissneri]|uniref:large ribosomal subunit protein uL1m n=1 Tax=Lethenteron reissneri TaxID=7753 RepID=UPI002AB6F4DA|nr:large ribosomal subunit protein uL1m [Lethenteron reissneri]